MQVKPKKLDSPRREQELDGCSLELSCPLAAALSGVCCPGEKSSNIIWVENASTSVPCYLCKYANVTDIFQGVCFCGGTHSLEAEMNWRAREHEEMPSPGWSALKPELVPWLPSTASLFPAPIWSRRTSSGDSQCPWRKLWTYWLGSKMVTRH